VREFHERSREVLKFKVLRFGAHEIETIAAALGETIACQNYTCYACTVMPDHVHIVIRKHKHRAEEMIERFQECSRLRLCSAGLRHADHPVWGGPGWKVFLDHPDEIRRTVRYVQENPVQWHLPPQSWEFVTAYNGWPLHPGHSPNSPYARQLRQ
jgi:REP element-mobilizing transposase RayT